jgi:glycine/D-amino acid oxidase-like deaminating enzyme
VRFGPGAESDRALITEPLWQEQAPVPPDLGVPRVPERTDVAVVGGGYTGLCTARRLAELGTDVVVLERHQIGWGASSRNGGKALVGLKPAASAVVRRFGKPLGKALWEASVEGIQLVEDLVAAEGIECDFVRSGSFFAASKPSHFSRMQRESEWLARELGYQRIDVPRDRQRDEIGTDFYHGGVVEPESAGLHPAKYVLGLARAACKAGAVLVPTADVHLVSRTSGGYELATTRGAIRAANVVIATNGYSGSLIPAVQRLVVPVGSYIIATAPLSPALQRELSPKGRMFYDSKWFLNYFRLTPDGRFLFGGRTTITPDQDLLQSAELLRRQLVTVFPALQPVPITHSWSGHLGVSFDALPRLGRMEGIFYAVGYSGHGVALSAYLGRDLAELVAGRRRTSPFSELPEGRRFYYRGRPWFRPLLAAGLRVADWLN